MAAESESLPLTMPPPLQSKSSEKGGGDDRNTTTSSAGPLNEKLDNNNKDSNNNNKNNNMRKSRRLSASSFSVFSTGSIGASSTGGTSAFEDFLSERFSPPSDTVVATTTGAEQTTDVKDSPAQHGRNNGGGGGGGDIETDTSGDATSGGIESAGGGGENRRDDRASLASGGVSMPCLTSPTDGIGLERSQTTGGGNSNRRDMLTGQGVSKTCLTRRATVVPHGAPLPIAPGAFAMTGPGDIPSSSTQDEELVDLDIASMGVEVASRSFQDLSSEEGGRSTETDETTTHSSAGGNSNVESRLLPNVGGRDGAATATSDSVSVTQQSTATSGGEGGDSSSTTTATAQVDKKRIGFNWKRRKNAAICVLVSLLVLAAIAAIIDMVLSSPSSSDRTNNGDVNSSSLTSTAPSSSPSTGSPTPNPTHSPTHHPTAAPTVLPWVQVGSDIIGVGAEDKFGFSVSISRGGERLAIGGLYHDRDGKADRGLVRLYEHKRDTDAWVQIGPDLLGENAEDYFGGAISLSGNGHRVAVGAWGHDDDNAEKTDSRFRRDNIGQVQIFEYQLGSWFRVGKPIVGEMAGDESGTSVSLSHDGNTVAIGSELHDGVNGIDSGHVCVYEFVSNEWIQKGSNLDGENAKDEFGYAVSLSADGRTVAVGGWGYDGKNGLESGYVRAYRYDDTTKSWTELGQELEGEAGGDRFGVAVTLSGNGNVLACGAHWNDAGGTSVGHVRVFAYDPMSKVWIQLGNDIDGEDDGDGFGAAVSLSADGHTLAVGGSGNDGSGSDKGHVRIFTYDADDDGKGWVQVGTDIDGSASGDESGWSVSLTGDGKRVAIGARHHDGNFLRQTGQVRVYENPRT